MPPNEPWGYPDSARRRSRRASTWGRWNRSRGIPIDESTVKVAACEIALDPRHTSDESRIHEMLTRFEHGTPEDRAGCEFFLMWAVKILEEDALGEARLRDVLRRHQRILQYRQ